MVFGTVVALMLVVASATSPPRPPERADAKAADRTGEAVCAQETRKLAEAEGRYLALHPAVKRAKLRVEAACLPAPTGDCAAARADVAEGKARYMERHPNLALARVRAQALCAPAPTPACARARADLAVALTKYLDKHPLALEARKAEARECAPPASPAAPARASL
jgi:hypothetical protein